MPHVPNVNRNGRTPMLRNAPPRKSGPPSTGERTTGRNTAHHHRTVPARGKQGPPREPRKLQVASEKPRDGFTCAWCGHHHSWPEMAGWDDRLKFCDTCVGLMDTIELGATGARK